MIVVVVVDGEREGGGVPHGVSRGAPLLGTPILFGRVRNTRSRQSVNARRNLVESLYRSIDARRNLVFDATKGGMPRGRGGEGRGAEDFFFSSLLSVN